jgi:hypothetical protein
MKFMSGSFKKGSGSNAAGQNKTAAMIYWSWRLELRLLKTPAQGFCGPPQCWPTHWESTLGNASAAV